MMSIQVQIQVQFKILAPFTNSSSQPLMETLSTGNLSGIHTERR